MKLKVKANLLTSIIVLVSCKSPVENNVSLQADTNNAKESTINDEYCQCNYFSTTTKKRFFALRDSFANILLKQNDTVLVFGLHYQEDTTKLLFIDNNKSQVYSYNSSSAVKFKFLKNQKTASILWKSFLINFDSLKNSYNIDGGYPGDHPFVYTVTLLTSKNKMDFCICQTQYAAIRRKPLGQMLRYFDDHLP
jgi:hypothetical protein